MDTVQKRGLPTEIAATARSILRFCPEPIATRLLVRCDDYIVALANADENPGGVIGDNWDKIGGNNSKCVAVEREHEVIVDSGID